MATENFKNEIIKKCLPEGFTTLDEFFKSNISTAHKVNFVKNIIEITVKQTRESV